MSFSVRPAGAQEMRTVWEWEYGALAGVEDWLAQMAGWGHIGIWRGAELVGVVSLQPAPAGRVLGHVSTKRRSCPRAILRRVLIGLINECFEGGAPEVGAIFPSSHRAARRLALSCRLQVVAEVQGYQLFTLPIARRFTE